MRSRYFIGNHELTTNHSASSYGLPVLLVRGVPHGPSDLLLIRGRYITAGEIVGKWASRPKASEGMRAMAARFLDGRG